MQFCRYVAEVANAGGKVVLECQKELVSLQKGEQAVQREKSACMVLFRELASGCNDFGDTAKVLSQLDLIITVDTSVAHLAGALGIPVWVAIPYNSDWRWMRERTGSPWYPSMTLFRQASPGDWGPVFKNMLVSLINKV